MTSTLRSEPTHLEFETKYAGARAARRYEALHRGRRRHRREERCIAAALDGLPRGARVLDAPCGTGRMLPLLTGMGYRVTGADLSRSMLAVARAGARETGVEALRQADLFDLPFEDASFDAVLCNRFLHHLHDSPRRVAALRELRRVARRRVVASFFCSRSYDAHRTRIKRRISGRRSDRSSLGFSTLRRDLEEAGGLRLLRVHRTLPWISQQWYLVAEIA